MKTYNLELTEKEMMLIESALRKQAEIAMNYPFKEVISLGKYEKNEDLSLSYIEVANVISDNLRL